MGQLSRRMLILFSLVATLTPALPAYAKDLVLSQDSISRFLATIPEMKVIAMNEGMKTAVTAKANKNPFLGLLRAISTSKLPAEAQNVVSAHGFQDLKEWQKTGHAIGHAYVFVTAGPSGGLSKETIEKHKETVNSAIAGLSFLSDEQKEKLKAKVDKGADEFAKDPPEENTALVKQMKTEIEAAATSQ